MAGSYPDVPGRRFAHHLDGTMLIYRNSAGAITDLTSYLADLNDHDNSGVFTTTNESTTVNGRHYTFVFPELRNIDGYFFYGAESYSDLNAQSVDVSYDTVDGFGGTWTQIAANWNFASALSPTWRSGINPLSTTGIKGLRFNFSWNSSAGSRSMNWHAMHLYGSVVEGENPNRLRAWHPTLDQEVDAAYFDFADMSQGTTLTKQFRLKNGNSTQTANNVTLSQDDTNGGGMGLTFSTDGVSFTSPLVIGNIAAGTTSSTLYVRRTVGAAEAVQLRSSVIKAVASSWT